MTHSSRDPFGRILPSAPAEPEISSLKNLFNLTGSVGGTAPNGRRDVAKVEMLMDRAGYIDLRQTDGPTGYYGERLKQAITVFQKDRGLKKDGTLNPRGETIRELARGAIDADYDRGERGPEDVLRPIPSGTRDRMNIPLDNLPGTRDRNNTRDWPVPPPGNWV